jgi:hypothetical protein
LQAQAQRAGKLEQTFTLPAQARDNRAERLAAALGPARREGLLPLFPLGSDMDEVEQSLVEPLTTLKNASYRELLSILFAGLSGAHLEPDRVAALERLGLAGPANMRDHVWRVLVTGALRKQ